MKNTNIGIGERQIKFKAWDKEDKKIMKEKIAEMYTQALIDDLAPNVFAEQVLRLFNVSGSLHYDEKLLIELWYKRNPCHELNSNSGEDMFWKTAFMVFEDYVREVSRNDR